LCFLRRVLKEEDQLERRQYRLYLHGDLNGLQLLQLIGNEQGQELRDEGLLRLGHLLLQSMNLDEQGADLGRICAVSNSGTSAVCRASRSCPRALICGGCSCRNSATTCSGETSWPSDCTSLEVSCCKMCSVLSVARSGMGVTGMVLLPVFVEFVAAVEIVAVAAGFCANAALPLISSMVSNANAHPVFGIIAISP
jgi:hypothetical protein